MCPDREQNPQPFSDGTALPPTEPPQPGLHPFLGPSSTPGHAGGSLLHPSAGTGATSALAAGAGAAVGTGPPVSWPLGPAPVAARPQADSPGGVCSFLSDRQAGGRGCAVSHSRGPGSRGYEGSSVSASEPTLAILCLYCRPGRCAMEPRWGWDRSPPSDLWMRASLHVLIGRSCLFFVHRLHSFACFLRVVCLFVVEL